MKPDINLEEEPFQEVFSKLKASPQTIMEVIDMTENAKRPKRFVLRRLAVAAMILALAAALAVGANAATNGQLFEKAIAWVSYSDDGQTILLSIDESALEDAQDGTPLEYIVEERGSGKASLIYKDKTGKTVIKDIDLQEKASSALEGGCPATESEPAAAKEHALEK